MRHLAEIVYIQVLILITTGSAFSQTPNLKFFNPQLNNSSGPLVGFVDMHAHPMAHLGFGGKVIHGAPATGILMPKDMAGCGKTQISSSITDSLGHCNPTHGGFGLFDNLCGDIIRNQLIQETEGPSHNREHGADKDGWPTFDHWPKANDITHQFMWVDWIRRSYEGGLRVMVALAVNSEAMAKGVRGHKPYDDKSVGDLQISELKKMVESQSFMEIAYSSQDLRRIVSADKLAIVIGLELDDIGNFNSYPPGGFTEETVRSEVRRLVNLGVRYIFPVHLVDNRFSGAALYKEEFFIANRLQAGYYFMTECSELDTGITTNFANSGIDIIKDLSLAAAVGINISDKPRYASCPRSSDGHGHTNENGLSYFGRIAIEEMMAQGIMLDIDHISQKAVQAVLSLTREAKYPINSGHSSLRSGEDGHEGDRTAAEYQQIGEFGGVIGIGWSNDTASDFGIELGEALAEVTQKGRGGGIALGTDANGLSRAPLAPVLSEAERSQLPQVPDRFDFGFPPYQTAERQWSYAEQGVANYGLMPEFLADVGRQYPEEVEKLFEGAEKFALMWEGTEAAAQQFSLRPLDPLEDDESFTPSIVTDWYCPQSNPVGDRDFSGNGPHISISTQLRRSSDEREIEAVVTFSAEETQSDWSSTSGTWVIPLYTAPRDHIISEIAGPELESYSAFLGSTGGFQIVGSSEENAVHRLLGSGIVGEYWIVGDTGGNDISLDGDCQDDTRIKMVFNPIRYRIEKI